MSKKLKQNEKSAPTIYQYSVTGLIDVYVGKVRVLSCTEKDLQTQQVIHLINKAKNGL